MGAESGIRSNRLNNDIPLSPLFSDKRNCRPHRADRINQIPEFPMIPEQRNKFLVLRPERNTDQQHTAQTEQQTAAQFPLQGMPDDGNQGKHQNRKQREKKKMPEQSRSKKVHRFAPVRQHDIDKHGPVDMHPVLIHKIGRGGSDQQYKSYQPLTDEAQRHDIENQGVCADQNSQKARIDKDGSPGKRKYVPKCFPEGQISRQDENTDIIRESRGTEQAMFLC